MTGEYHHSLDAKGRLFIPARLREELGSEFYVTLSTERCLNAYSAESWKNFSAKVSALPTITQNDMRLLFVYAARCELDSQGRIILPQNLRERVGIEKSVTVLGVNNHAEFWSTEEWQKRDLDAAFEKIKAVMQEYGL